MRGRRVCKGLTVTVVAAMTAVGLSGCGSGVGLSSATFTTPPPIPGEITQTATRTAVPSSSTSSAAPAKSSTAKNTAAKAKKATSKPATSTRVALRGDEQRVTVKAAGITFGAPLTLGRVDSDALLNQSANSPEMTALAQRLGVSTTTLRDGLLRQTDTILVGSTVLIVMHLPAQEIPDDDLLRRQLELGSGGTVTKIRHLTTKAGPAVRASIRIKAGGMTLAGDALMIRTKNGVANVSTTSASPSISDAIMVRVVKTVQPIR